MSAAVSAEENILKLLEGISAQSGTHVGLIIGQVVAKKIFAVHIAATPEQSYGTSLSNLLDVDEAGIAEHSRYVTRMLPGGMWVLGVFVVGPDDVFAAPNVTCLKKVLAAVDKSISQGFPLLGRNPNGAYLILHYNGTTKKYSSKVSESLGGNVTGFKNIEWKFANSTGSWCQINSQFLLLEDFMGATLQFPKHIEDIMANISKTVQNTIVHICGKSWEPSCTLDKILKEDHSLDATLLLPSIKNGSTEMKVAESASQIRITGSIPSRVFLYRRCSVEEAAAALRQDIIRSLATRLEMHLDSLVEENDDEGKDSVVHVPPRRVMIRPNGWKIQLSDYLFPGENSEETIRTCKELLGLELEMGNVETDFEHFADSSGISKDAALERSSVGDTKTAEKAIAPIFVIFAFITLILGFLLHYIFF